MYINLYFQNYDLEKTKLYSCYTIAVLYSCNYIPYSFSENFVIISSLLENIDLKLFIHKRLSIKFLNDTFCCNMLGLFFNLLLN